MKDGVCVLITHNNVSPMVKRALRLLLEQAVDLPSKASGEVTVHLDANGGISSVRALLVNK